MPRPAQRPPGAGGGQAVAAVVDDDRMAGADAGAPQRRLKRGRVGQRVPAAGAGRAAQLGVQVDEHGAGEVAGRYSVRPSELAGAPGMRSRHRTSSTAGGSACPDSAAASVVTSTRGLSGAVTRSSQHHRWTAAAPPPAICDERPRGSIGPDGRAGYVKDLVDTTEMYLRTILELEEEGVPPLRARIAERLHQSGPTVSQTVARMERDGLLTVEGDRHLHLTELGRTPRGLRHAQAPAGRAAAGQRDRPAVRGGPRGGLPVGARDERRGGAAGVRPAEPAHPFAVRQPDPGS